MVWSAGREGGASGGGGGGGGEGEIEKVIMGKAAGNHTGYAVS